MSYIYITILGLLIFINQPLELFGLQFYITILYILTHHDHVFTWL